MRKQVTLQEIIKAFGESLKASIYHSMPGIVTAYYPGSPATVDVQPAVNDVRFDLDTGERVSEPWPVLSKVPVLYPSGGGFSVTFPLSPGDPVELVADDLDPTVFLQTGNRSDPSDVRRHGGNYWKAYPCNRTDKNAPAAGSTLKIGKGSTIIEMDGSTIALGGASVSDNVALASLVKSELNKIAAAFNSFSPGSGGASFGHPYTSASDVKSTLVKSG